MVNTRGNNQLLYEFEYAIVRHGMCSWCAALWSNNSCTITADNALARCVAATGWVYVAVTSADSADLTNTATGYTYAVMSHRLSWAMNLLPLAEVHCKTFLQKGSCIPIRYNEWSRHKACQHAPCPHGHQKGRGVEGEGSRLPVSAVEGKGRHGKGNTGSTQNPNDTVEGPMKWKGDTH